MPDYLCYNYQIISLSLHKQRQIANGKKFYLSDSRIFKEAERLINDEIAWVLGIDETDVPAFVESVISQEA